MLTEMMEGKERVMNEEEEERQQVWSCGAGTEGQLATGKLQDEHLPCHLVPRIFYSGGGPISLLSCGGAHVICLTSGATPILVCLYCS